MEQSRVTVELFGIARHLAGREVVVVDGNTIHEVLTEVRSLCPRLADVVHDNGSLSRHFLISLDGDRFIDDVRCPVPPGSRLLILGADPGG